MGVRLAIFSRCVVTTANVKTISRLATSEGVLKHQERQSQKLFFTNQPDKNTPINSGTTGGDVSERRVIL
jgi:hypothetical protein